MKMIQWVANTVKPDEWRKMIGMIMCLWYFDDDGNEDCLKLLGKDFMKDNGADNGDDEIDGQTGISNQINHNKRGN